MKILWLIKLVGIIYLIHTIGILQTEEHFAFSKNQTNSSAILGTSTVDLHGYQLNHAYLCMWLIACEVSVGYYACAPLSANLKNVYAI